MTQPTGRRRLIAALRVPPDDERLLAMVRPYLPEADSAGELAYRLWRRGLELTLAELAGLGAMLPAELSEEQLATLSAQRVVSLLPLLRRTGKLALLGLEQAAQERQPAIGAPTADTAIDASATAAISSLGGGDFL